jgi:hypothetical protein
MKALEIELCISEYCMKSRYMYQAQEIWEPLLYNIQVVSNTNDPGWLLPYIKVSYYDYELSKSNALDMC